MQITKSNFILRMSDPQSTIITYYWVEGIFTESFDSQHTVFDCRQTAWHTGSNEEIEVSHYTHHTRMQPFNLHLPQGLSF